jgi:cellulose synthase/poly-beta-1,6-N-acetylglucosamine synthase-like glycosyltransferase
MMFFSFLTAIVAVSSVPVLIFFIEVVAALSHRDRAVQPVDRGAPRRLAVIIPAHNESTGLLPTISDIKPQLKDGDRLLVIADNCSDDTAAVAATAGAEVVTRADMTRIGKGYALSWAIDHLSAAPPDLVLFIDADCRVQPDLIERLTGACCASGRPTQASFLMKTAENSPIDHGLAEFAFLVKNWVRPLGLKNLDGPVQLLGTGMIFPWDAIRTVPLASGHLVEDLKLGLDLAAMGKAPRFCPSAKVTSDFPVTAAGTDSQRQRWVQGHVGMILGSAPRLLLSAISGGNAELLALTLDLLVPPLILLGFLTSLIFFVMSCVALLGGPVAPAIIGATNFVTFALAISIAWFNFGREVLPPQRLRSIFPGIFKKAKLFVEMLMGRTVSSWVRTEREKKA